MSAKSITELPTAAPRSSDVVLAVEDLSVEFLGEHGWTQTLDRVGFTVRRDEVVGLVGESGSGKTVTSMAIMGLLRKGNGRISHGRVELAGLEITAMSAKELRAVRGNRIAMIFQEPMTSLNPAFKVGNQIAETVRKHRGVSKKYAWAVACKALDNVGIPNAERRAHAYPHEFSGGMRQRAMIAMALSCEPDLLIADEPTTALDVTIQAQILDLLREIRSDYGTSILFITHDLGVVADICNEVIVMYAGQVVEQSPVKDLFHNPVHPYTEGLLRSTPTVPDGGTGLFSIPGSPPIAGQFPNGCRFHPRCSYATESCVDTEIELRPITATQSSRCIRTPELSLRGVRSSP